VVIELREGEREIPVMGGEGEVDEEIFFLQQGKGNLLDVLQ
jgi:hypothetical protein